MVYTKLNLIRNFCIVAHIDHGKSTLADRFIELSGTVDKRLMLDQFLDKMELERERGITIKSQSIRILHNSTNGKTYQLNLIDTPGHIDFSGEVVRSLSVCEGCLLLVDATQGIEAQTIANARLSIEQGLEIIPVINKIDMPNAQPDIVAKQMIDLFGFIESELVFISAKTGKNVNQLFKKIVEKIPPPTLFEDANELKAFIFDSEYNSFKGIIASIRVYSGEINCEDKLKLMKTNLEFDAIDVGYVTSEFISTKKLKAGEVGYIVTGIKDYKRFHLQDTITSRDKPAKQALKVGNPITPIVYTGIFPTENDEYSRLRDGIEKLALNDQTLVFEPEFSNALGFGFRCGFLGSLHMEVVQERLEREFDLNIILTAPSVKLLIELRNGRKLEVGNPAKFPETQYINRVYEPVVSLNIVTPQKYSGVIIELLNSKRAKFCDMEYANIIATKNSDSQEALMNTCTLKYEIPLSELLAGFNDQIKSISSGHASLDYKLSGYKEANLVKLNILINHKVVDALSIIVHREKAYQIGKNLIEKLKKEIQRQLFEVPIQAAIGNKIVARETIKALRKNVLAKCYGGDVTRKRKLLQKQIEGKKRMRKIGSVELPQSAFTSVLRLN